ncbi:FecR family protein [bacterium A37T11]|nr:FecR family protein [bacterium A37T11]
MSNQEEIQQLIILYTDGTASPAERQRLENWYETIQAPQAPFSSEAAKTLLQQQLLQGIYRQRPALKPRHQVRYIRLYYSSAAILLIALATALYFYRSTSIVNRPSKVVNEVGPGKNRAILTLADGTKVNLDSAKSGIQINDENINYNDGTKIIAPIHHSSAGSRTQSFITYNSLTTPKGGQYQIILEDGTKVWLNAASTLKYPSRFSGEKREVFLEGEAYFEVNNNPSIGAVQENRKSYLVPRKSNEPFIVKSKNQEITVLGTSFNVKAFADEKVTKTTLVTGKVQVRSKNLKLKTYNPDISGQAIKLLKPAQQAVLKGDSLTVNSVDVNKETAWRSNKFSFTGKTFKQVIDELARWYDLEVVYTNGIPDETFVGSAYRNEKLSAVLKILKSYKVNYHIAEGRKLIIENLTQERISP